MATSVGPSSSYAYLSCSSVLLATASGLPAPTPSHAAAVPAPLPCSGAAEGLLASPCFGVVFLHVHTLRQPTISTPPVYYSWPTPPPSQADCLCYLAVPPHVSVLPPDHGPVCTHMAREPAPGIAEGRHDRHAASSGRCAVSPETATALLMSAAAMASGRRRRLKEAMYVVYVLNGFSARQGSNDTSLLVRQSRRWAARIAHDPWTTSPRLDRRLVHRSAARAKAQITARRTR